MAFLGDYIGNEPLKFQLPFTIPFLDQTQPPTIVLDKSTFQLGMRLIVIICTYLLFRPRLQALFRSMSGNANDQDEVKERLKRLESERSGSAVSGGPRKIAVVEGKSAGTPRTPAAANTEATPNSGKSSGRRRKA